MSLADEIGSRRCDLLFAAPGQPLANAGVPVIRVPAAAARAGRGAALDNVAALLTKVPDPPHGGVGHQTVWAAAQTHRLIAAICEALAAGMLNTGAWRINVTGPTGLAERLVGPYLELIDAFDIMAGDRHVAPEEVRFYSRSDVAWYRRTAACVYELVDGSDRADEPSDTCPEVAIRIASLLRAHSAQPGEDVERFRDALIYNWLIAGTDAHAKNYSLMLAGGQVRLAPLYDVCSFLPYRGDGPVGKIPLAMRIGRDYTITKADRPNAWKRTAEAMGLLGIPPNRGDIVY